jgi:hypothetical protein
VVGIASVKDESGFAGTRVLFKFHKIIGKIIFLYIAYLKMF